MPYEIKRTFWVCRRGHEHSSLEQAERCDTGMELVEDRKRARELRALERQRVRQERYDGIRLRTIARADARRKSFALTDGPFAGLTPQTANALRREGLLTREQVIDYCGSRPEFRLMHIPRLGRVLIAEVILWLAEDVTPMSGYYEQYLRGTTPTAD